MAAEDADRFAHAVTRILRDRALRDELSRQARAKAAQWSDSALADRMLALYEELKTRSGAGFQMASEALRGPS